MTNDDPMAFLQSTRFWAMVIGCIAILFGKDGIITPESIHQALLAFSGGFMATRTIDRTVEKLSNKEPQIDV